MERREGRRAPGSGLMAGSVTIPRRRHRSGLRDSPEEDGQAELQEPAVRLRDRGSKKDRDRDRDNRDRERDRERISRNKRRRAGDEDTSEESVNDEEEEEEEEGGVGGGMRMLPPNPAVVSVSSSVAAAATNMNHHHPHHSSQHQLPRKSFPPSSGGGGGVGGAKVFPRATVPAAWKPTDEMIGVSVPRKARSASTKRSHDWISGGGGGNSGGGGGGNSGGGGGGVEQINHRQASTSPVRQSLTPSPAAAAPLSPSSSNASVRKKLKPSGSKPRPPKSSSKSASSNPEELEIEIAEVLYGLMTQSQGLSKKEAISSSDAKSRVSSPISNSPQNLSSSAAPLSAVAPKRKRPRQVSDNPGSYGVRSSATMKVEMDQGAKTEVSSPNLEKNFGSATENGRVNCDSENLAILQALPELPSVAISMKPEPSVSVSELKALPESDVVSTAKEEVYSSGKESPAVKIDDNREDATVTATKVIGKVSEINGQKEEKFQIDLMAPPPQVRSSPERECEIHFAAAAEEHKMMISEADAETKQIKGKEFDRIGKEETVNVEAGENKAKVTAEDAESKKHLLNKERNIDLQLDLEKPDREIGSMGSGSGVGCNKFQHQVLRQARQPPQKATKDEAHSEKSAQPNSLPLPMPVANWPGGLPPMGYMAPLQGVVSMDGSAMPSAPIQPLFSQPRAKRCATHCYIARNIHYLQQFMKMNPFWSAAASSASLFGAKPCNLNVMPAAELQGNVAGRSLTSVQDKAQGVAIYPGHTGKEKGSQVANIQDPGQRKQQILLQQALPPVAPNNMLHGPAFIFPFNQQQAAMAAASARPGSAKSPSTTGSVGSAAAPNAASAAAAATAMSFNYPNMPSNDTQFLAILQNNAYHFPMPAVGAPPNYRGNHSQSMPFINGPFYSSQMIHPSQMQQQQQPPPSQPQQMQASHQNTSSGSSSSQKHLHNQQQQRPQGGSVNGGSGSGNLPNFAAPKNRSSQPPQQQQQNQHTAPAQVRHLESEVGGEDSPSTADSRVSRATMNVYGPNFAMPIHPQSFALMTPSGALTGANAPGGSGNQNEKKQQQSQQQGLKPGLDSLPPQSFAMSFAPMNSSTTAPVIDISSMATNHAILQSLPEATRQSFQMIAAATAAQQVAQHKKNFGLSEDGRNGGADFANADEERKGSAGKAPPTAGQSIAFSRPDLVDASNSSISGNNVIDSSARSLHLSSGPARTSRSPMPNAIGNANLQAQLQHQQHQQHQMIQLHKHQQQHQQQQLAAAVAVAARSKTQATSNGSAYSEHKFSSALSAFPQNFVQGSNSSSPTQSPQWKNSTRTPASQVPSSLASSTSPSLKNLPQQQARAQQSHTQISFGANQKSSAVSQGQQPPSGNQSPTPPLMVGSPTHSSISKGASGSPRTTSASTGNKSGQVSTLSAQHGKNSPSTPSQKSSPVGGRNVPSILSSSSNGSKSQLLQQQQQFSKSTLQQPQLYFSNPYMQAQAPHSASSAASTASGYYLQRRRPEQQQQPQQTPGSSATSTGMLSLCPPVTSAGASTSDPAKAVAAAAAAAASNMKGGGLPSQSILHAAQFAAQSSGGSHQLMPAGFSFVHPVPSAVQVKPAEQKQPAGNDNLHACWQPEKK